MRKLIFLWIALVVVSLQALANDKVSFTASAPDAVAVGDQFRLAYTVTTQKVRDFRAPSIKGFDVLMGPSRSQQSSMQIVNGVSTSTSSITFTYILMATAEGSFTIPGATITADGNQMVSNSVQIKVLPADQAGAALVDDPLQGFLQAGARFLGHMQQLVLQPFVHQLMQALAKNVRLPNADGVLLEVLQKAHDQFF